MALLGAGGIATGASIVRLILVMQTTSAVDETVAFVRFYLLGYLILPPLKLEKSFLVANRNIGWLK